MDNSPQQFGNVVGRVRGLRPGSRRRRRTSSTTSSTPAGRSRSSRRSSDRAGAGPVFPLVLAQCADTPTDRVTDLVNRAALRTRASCRNASVPLSPRQRSAEIGAADRARCGIPDRDGLAHREVVANVGGLVLDGDRHGRANRRGARPRPPSRNAHACSRSMLRRNGGIAASSCVLYWRFASRESNTATTPRSVRRRISRPAPCASTSAAAGMSTASNGIDAALLRARRAAPRASGRRAPGTGSCRSPRARTRRRRHRSRPRTTACRRAPTSRLRGTSRARRPLSASPWASTSCVVRDRRTSAKCATLACDVQSTSARPPAAFTSRHRRSPASSSQAARSRPGIGQVLPDVEEALLLPVERRRRLQRHVAAAGVRRQAPVVVAVAPRARRAPTVGARVGTPPPRTAARRRASPTPRSPAAGRAAGTPIRSPGATGAMRSRRLRPIVSTHTTSSASGAARRRNTSRRPVASCDGALGVVVATCRACRSPPRAARRPRRARRRALRRRPDVDRALRLSIDLRERLARLR